MNETEYCQTFPFISLKRRYNISTEGRDTGTRFQSLAITAR